MSNRSSQFFKRVQDMLVGEKKKSQKQGRNWLYGSRIDDIVALLTGKNICIFPKHYAQNPFRMAMMPVFVEDGRVMTSDDMKRIPVLVDFASLREDDDYAVPFVKHISFLIQEGYQLYVYSDQILRPVKWDNNFIVEDITEIDIKTDTVVVRTCGKYYDFFLDNLYTVDKHIVWDKNVGVMGRVKPVEYSSIIPWRQCEIFADYNQTNVLAIKSREDFSLATKSFEISKNFFNNHGLKLIGNFDEYIAQKYIIKNNGNYIPIENAVAQPKMIIQHDVSRKTSALEGQLVFDKKEFPLDWHDDGFKELRENVYEFVEDCVEKLFAENDRFFVIKSCFLASCVKTEQEIKAIIETVTKKIPKERGNFDNRKAVYDFFIFLYRFSKDSLLKLLYVKEDKMYFISANYYYYWLFYALPHLIFEKTNEKTKNRWHAANSTELSVQTNVLYERLEAFKRLLDQHSIALYLDKKPIKLAAFDVKVDIARPEKDWFELHSQVHYDGEKITPDQWSAIAQGNGLWDREDEVVIVDAQAQSAVNLLSRWMKKEESHKDARQVIKVPRLRMFDLIELRKSGVVLKVSEEDDKILNNLARFTQVARMPLPKDLKCVLRDYQKEGYYWLSFLYQHRFGACLADDMGLGKTVQAIAFLGAIKENILENRQKPHLIVVPTSLVFNWVNEIKSFYSQLMVTEYTSTTKPCAFDRTNIIITTYDIVRRDTQLLSQIDFNVIIFDEAQSVKNITAKRTSAARALKGDFKLCITGTPLENHIGEYYSIMDLALPGLLPEYAEFKSDISSNGTTALVNRTKPFILRRTKEIIAKELPEKIESDVYFYMTEKQRSLYTRITQEVRNEVAKAYENKTKAQASIVALTALLRLRQICISPDLVIPAKKAEPTPKLDYIIEQLPTLVRDGHAALVFSQFTKCLDLIEEELKLVGIKYGRIDGSVPAGQRKKIVESFQKDKTIDVLLMSLKTGGVGLNLTRASYVFHIDPWWNAAAENQASDRAYRIGQKNTVIVSRLLMHHSIEEKMLALKKDKQQLFKAIVEGAGDKAGCGLSQADFDFLLG